MLAHLPCRPGARICEEDEALGHRREWTPAEHRRSVREHAWNITARRHERAMSLSQRSRNNREAAPSDAPSPDGTSVGGHTSARPARDESPLALWRATVITTIGGAAIGRVGLAVGRHRSLAQADLTALAWVIALGNLGAGRTSSRICEFVGRAGRRQTDRRRGALDNATTKAVTAIRGKLPAVVDALLRLRAASRTFGGVLVGVVWVVWTPLLS